MYLLAFLANLFFCFSLCAELCFIPKKIWQTYRTKDLPPQAKQAQSTWLDQNPEYAYELWDDDDIEKYILREWDADTYRFFKALPLGVMKADLWRYLILKTDGGIYSDIDSICCSPIREWTSQVFTANQNVLLLGLERRAHFCQWTIAATPNHPAMEYVCKYLIKNWKQNGIELEKTNFVHLSTGPTIWTQALIEYLGFSPRTTVEQIYEKYKAQEEIRQKINRLGVFLFPSNFYNGGASKNLYGSRTFGEGYASWLKEKKNLAKANERNYSKRKGRCDPPRS